MTILDNSTRFLLLDKPITFPNYDIHSKSQEGPVFDLGVDLEYFNGVVYVKAEHIETMARVLGMATKDEVETLNARIRDLEAENAKLPNGVEELVNGISDLVSNYRADTGISVPPYLVDPEPDKDAGEESGNESQPDSDDSSESAGNDSGSGEPTGQSNRTSGNKRSPKFSASPDNEFSFDNL